MSADLQTLWPVPLARRRWADADAANPVLARVFQAMRATAPNAGGAFYASEDDLLNRVDLPEFTALVQFFAGALQSAVQQLTPASGRMAARRCNCS